MEPCFSVFLSFDFTGSAAFHVIVIITECQGWLSSERFTIRLTKRIRTTEHNHYLDLHFTSEWSEVNDGSENRRIGV